MLRVLMQVWDVCQVALSLGTFSGCGVLKGESLCGTHVSLAGRGFHMSLVLWSKGSFGEIGSRRDLCGWGDVIGVGMTPWSLLYLEMLPSVIPRPWMYNPMWNLMWNLHLTCTKYGLLYHSTPTHSKYIIATIAKSLLLAPAAWQSNTTYWTYPLDSLYSPVHAPSCTS